MSKVKIKPEAIAEDLGGVMVLKLGKETPSNALEIYNKLKTLLDNKETFLCLIYDTTAGVYLGDCEATKSGDVIQLIQIRTTITDDVVKMFKYVYEFHSDGTYRRVYKSINLVTQE